MAAKLVLKACCLNVAKHGGREAGKQGYYVGFCYEAEQQAWVRHLLGHLAEMQGFGLGYPPFSSLHKFFVSQFVHIIAFFISIHASHILLSYTPHYTPF